MAVGMSIKRKLTLNLVIVLLAILCVAASGLLGMGQVRSRLVELTERSTPFQLRTTESQRATQLAMGELDRMARARSRAEFQPAAASAAEAMKEAESAAQALSELAGGEPVDGMGELGELARQLTDVTRRRLVSDSAATAAVEAVGGRLGQLEQRVAALDQRVRALQKGQQSAFRSAAEQVAAGTSHLRELDQLKALLFEAQASVLELQAATAKSAVTIARARLNTQAGKINQNAALAADRSLQSGAQGFLDQVDALVKAKQEAVEGGGAEAGARLAEAQGRVKESLAVVMLAVQETGQVAATRSGQEQERQSRVMEQSALASSVLLQAAELVALSQAVQALSSRLATVRSGPELDSLRLRLEAEFQRGLATGKSLGTNLGRLDAKAEQALLAAALGQLQSSRTELTGPGGVVERVASQLGMARQAAEAGESLRLLVTRQAEKGRVTLSSARGEQEKSIGTVNRVVRLSLVLILASSAAALAFGVLFGGWVYRSIARALAQVQSTMSRVEAEADFSLRAPVESDDELGRMATAFNTLLATQQHALDEVGRVMSALAAGDFSQRVHADLKGDLARLRDSVNGSADQIQHVLGDALGVVRGLAEGDLARRVAVEGLGELGQLKNHLNHSLESLGGTLGRLREQALQTSSTARETRAAVGQISSDVHRQTERVGQVEASLVDATGDSRLITGRTRDAARISRDAVDRVRRGLESMASLEERVQRVALTSGHIQGISDTIRRIAAQTRMLSLNATIEAARAGDAGAGFAVVAHEVGQLADSSTASAGEIAQLVLEACQRVDEAVLSVTEVGGELRAILEGSLKADQELEEVARSLESQQHMLLDIETSMSELKTIAESNAGSAEEISATMGELDIQAEATRKEIEAFRLS
jgi:methyl-accepting chemotaxis protein